MRTERGLDGAHLALLVCAVAFPIGLPAEERGANDPSQPTYAEALIGVRGASDVARAHDGRLWVITERTHQLVSVDGRTLPIVGVAEGLELESFAFTSSTGIVIGTERDDARTADAVLFGRIDADRVTVIGQRAVDYARLGLEVAPNGGIEGLCVAGRDVYVAIETAAQREGRRVGALVSVTSTAVAFVALGTDTGKLSALACEVDAAGGLTLWAIERHYGIARVLRFPLPSIDAPGLIRPELWSNLAPALRPAIPNLEGLTVTGQDIWLVEDNDPGRPDSPTRLLRVPRSGDRAGHIRAETR